MADKVISFIQEFGQGCYVSKTDIENAFRITPDVPLQ